MRPHPPIPIRLASLSLAALGLMLPSRADAASSTYGVTDLGAGVSGLVLGNGGQVAGFTHTPGESTYYSGYIDGNPIPIPPGTAFKYDAGRFTSLVQGVVPVAVADDGRVIDARGPFTLWGTEVRNTFFVGPLAAAGNHLGELVGTGERHPAEGLRDGWGPQYPNPIFYSGYLYVPKTGSCP